MTRKRKTAPMQGAPATAHPADAPAASAGADGPPPLAPAPGPVVRLLERDESQNGAPLVATAAGLERIEALAAEGHSDAGVAAALGINRKTLRHMRDRQPDVDEALARGRAVLEHELTHVLLKAAREGQWVAALALGKTRLGWREGQERDASPTVSVQVIQLPAPAASLDDYVRALPPPTTPDVVDVEPEPEDPTP